MKKRKLTTKQAWLYIAEDYEKPLPNRPTNRCSLAGLCNAIRWLVNHGMITQGQLWEMFRAIKNLVNRKRRRFGNRYSAYLFTGEFSENRLKRARVARRLASKS